APWDWRQSPRPRQSVRLPTFHGSSPPWGSCRRSPCCRLRSCLKIWPFTASLNFRARRKRFTPETVPNKGEYGQVKGSCRTTRQLPSTGSAAGRSSPEGHEWLVRPSPSKRTGPTSLLNHETSDHLLSLLDCNHRMLWSDEINKTCNCGQFRQSSMLRAASGQLGTATIGLVPPATTNRPRLNAIASSNGS